MRTPIILGSILVAVGIFVGLVLTCSGQTARSSSGSGASTWSTDTAKLAAAVPLFRTIEKASWTVVVDADRSGGLVPGPSAYATLGFAKVDSATIADLGALGKQADDGSVTTAITQHLSDICVPQSGRTWLRVVGLDRVLVSRTKFMRGEMLIDESAQLVFFRLVAD